MGFITSEATAALGLIFNNTDWANIGDAAGLQNSVTAGSFYVALFTADPTASGSAANEANYTGYARVAVARDSGGFTISGNNCSNTAVVTFGECTAGSSTVTHFALCKGGTAGVADLVLRGALGASLAISTTANQIPQFAIGALDVNALTTT